MYRVQKLSRLWQETSTTITPSVYVVNVLKKYNETNFLKPALCENNLLLEQMGTQAAAFEGV